MHFANIRNDEIIDMDSQYLDEDITKVETTDDLYDAFQEDRRKVIYSEGEIVLNPNYEEEKTQQEREKIAQLSLTKREVFLALYKDKGITPEQIKAQISDPEVLIEFEYANEYFRGNPLIDSIGQSLGYTSGDMDYLFINKELPNDKMD